jgi:hypothetical protein
MNIIIPTITTGNWPDQASGSTHPIGPRRNCDKMRLMTAASRQRLARRRPDAPWHRILGIEFPGIEFPGIKFPGVASHWQHGG